MKDDDYRTYRQCGGYMSKGQVTKMPKAPEGPGPGQMTSEHTSSEISEHLSWLPAYLEEVLELMASRGAKYGPGNIAEFGELGVLVRLSDKLARLRHTTENFEDETSADSWLDVIGYGLIGLAWCRGDWPGSEKA